MPDQKDPTAEDVTDTNLVDHLIAQRNNPDLDPERTPRPRPTSRERPIRMPRLGRHR